MKIAFFGTPDFAVPSLNALLKSNHEVVCVVTQPDKPQGRGGRVMFGAVKKFALEHGIPVLQPQKISNELNILDGYAPDIIVTCAFGQILKQNVLDYPKYGVINVHGSLLPKYRGSSPIQWAIINGEKKTGVTIMHTDIGLDTGDMILKREICINDGETAGELFTRLSILGAEALIETLGQIESGTANRTPQDHSQSTKFPMLSKENAKIDFSKTAFEIINFVRGLNPWPVAWFEHSGQIIRVFKAAVATSENDGFAISCKGGYVKFDVIQLEGGKVLPAKDYINGRKIHI